MLVTRLQLGALETNCWIVADDAGGPAVVIDPGDDAQAVLDAVGKRGVGAIVLTHNHFDHIGAVAELVSATRAPLMAHAIDADGLTDANRTGGAHFGFLKTAPPADRTLADGDEVEIGEARLSVVHTPGHTPGGICLILRMPEGEPMHLFSGDTLFAGSVGRTDFPGGDAHALSSSIARLATLPAEMIVHPGHGPDSTIGRERRLNPFFPRA